MTLATLSKTDQLQLSYLVTFANGSLDPSVDQPDFGPMKIGDSQDKDSNPVCTPQDGGMFLQITRPSTAKDVVSVGIFATPVSFGTGTVFEEHATFISPSGPHDSNVWAVGLSARTGSNNDLAAEARTAATFQVLGASAKLHAVGATAPTSVHVPQEIYDAIFNPDELRPFTLKLRIDRETGESTVTLIVDDQVQSLNFQSADFGPDFGLTITAVGPSVAIASGSGVTASVELREFRILL